MTDPVYGDSPIDPDQRWWLRMRPVLVNDPEIRVWQAVITGHMRELLESSWLVRWRVGSPLTAEGVHLDALAEELGLLRPDGWDDDRLGPLVVAIEAATLGRKTAEVTANIAEALVQPGQTWAMSQAGPANYTVYWFGISGDEAQTYAAALDYGRPKGIRLQFAWSAVDAGSTFTLGTSALDGPDILANTL